MASLASPRAELRNVLLIDAVIVLVGLFCSPFIRLAWEAGLFYIWHNIHSMVLVLLFFVLFFLLTDI